jgi:hypothetical protein
MKELIELAKEKGFETNHMLVVFGCSPQKLSESEEDSIYYLWMCELQKWLRDEQKINIDIEFDRCEGLTVYRVTLWYPHLGYSCEKYTYEEALEKGLFEALKLID